MFDRELIIIGLHSESMLKGHTSSYEIRKVVRDTLELYPFVEPLLQTIITEYHLDAEIGSFPIKYMFKALYSHRFLRSVPPVNDLFIFGIFPQNVNLRENNINIKIIIAAFICYKMNYLQLDEIQQGLWAFSMIERERLKPNIPIDRKLINKCLMLANSVICEKVIKMWISEYTPLFECTTELRRTIAKGDEQGLAITLFPHEFLFLMCNGKKRNPLLKSIQKRKRKYPPRDDNTGTYPVNAHLQKEAQREDARLKKDPKGLIYSEFMETDQINNSLQNVLTHEVPVSKDHIEFKGIRTLYKKKDKRKELEKRKKAITIERIKKMGIPGVTSKVLQQMLRDDVLYNEIKRQLQGGNFQLLKLRLNNKYTLNEMMTGKSTLDNMKLVPNPITELKRNPDYIRFTKVHPTRGMMDKTFRDSEVNTGRKRRPFSAATKCRTARKLDNRSFEKEMNNTNATTMPTIRQASPKAKTMTLIPLGNPKDKLNHFKVQIISPKKAYFDELINTNQKTQVHNKVIKHMSSAFDQEFESFKNAKEANKPKIQGFF